MKALRWLAYSMMSVSLVTLLPTIATDSFARDGGRNSANEIRLRTMLTGVAINSLVPSGNAEFRIRSGLARIKVEVENINLPANAVLSAFATIDGAETKLGDLILEPAPSNEAELELNARDGDVVPANIVAGTLITVKQNGTLVASGLLK